MNETIKDNLGLLLNFEAQSFEIKRLHQPKNKENPIPKIKSLQTLTNMEGVILSQTKFVQEDVFKTTIWRNDITSGQATGQLSGQLADYDTDYDTDYEDNNVDELIKRIIFILATDMTREKLMDTLALKHPGNFRENYLHPALEQGYIEMTLPDTPKSKKQKYRLTAKGKKLQQNLRNKS